jgi:hypothetical protein
MSHPRLLVLVVATLLLAGPAQAATTRTADVKGKQPTQLWKEYPLRQRAAVARVPPRHEYRSETREATSSRPVTDNPFPLLVIPALVAAVLAITTLLLAQPLTSVVVGRKGPAARERRPSSPAHGPRAPIRFPIPLKRAAERAAAWGAALVPPKPAAKPHGSTADDLTEARRAVPEPKPAGKPLAATPAPPPRRTRSGAAESCQIRLWHGYVKSQLLAAPLEKSGEPEGLAFSPFFRLRDPGAPTESAEAALRALIEQLERDGWTVVGAGPRWYQRALER